MLVFREPPTPHHQAIQQSLVNALGEAARRRGSHHTAGRSLDVLLGEAPRFHFRRPDVVVHRCSPEDRSSRWRGKPFACDVLLAVEIVSNRSVSADLDHKRAEYARAGIPNYWLVRMADNDGPAVSMERLRLRADGRYVSEYVAFRNADPLAADVIDPLELKLTWDQLDEWL
jgi:Uma2 family endonuclease